ncbi:MAG TPA: thioredoxin domain-containing protein [Candidatus Sulfotelmatobacter sp.]|jgi:protein-disulfide isomerase|nr:thioredoxin domain-containing protein [Candidatus Sulfotelmatobacter sp.]
MRGLLNASFVFILAMNFAYSQATGANAAAAPKATPAADELPSEATVESFLHQQFGYQPGLSWKISSIRPSAIPGLAEVNAVLASEQGQSATRFYVSRDGKHAIVGDVIPFGARPFDPAKKILEKGLTGPSRGPKDAAATIVEFGDLQCPACKAAQPTIEALVAAEPNARFVFQNFPLEMHNWAAKGAAYAECVGVASNDAFWKFVAKTYETQQDITSENVDEKLTAIADGAGVKGSEIAACAAKLETKSRVDASIALGKSVEVSGTPTLFINGRRIGSVERLDQNPQIVEVYKKLVEFAAKN